MIGARDLAFPRLNLLSWYIYMIGGAVHALACSSAGGVDTGWTFYTPFSTHVLEHATSSPAAIGVFIVGFSSILTGLNFIVTIHKMRAPGHDLVPAAAVRLGACTPPASIMVLGTRCWRSRSSCWRSSGCCGVGIFDPALGGDPILFQHLFWFYSHPAVYIMILPGMGVVSEIDHLLLAAADLRLHVHGRAPCWRSRCSASWSGATTCSSAASRCTPGMVFSFLSFLVAIPSAIKVFNWTATLYKGSISLRHADALRPGLHRPVHDRRPDRAVPRRARPSTSTCTTPTSSSPTSTTSWSAAR